MLKWRVNVPKKATVLTLKQKQKRLESDRWVLLHDPDFFSLQVIWSDKKYFGLKQGPNRQIDRYWASENPQIIVECKTQSQQKAMCWTYQKSLRFSKNKIRNDEKNWRRSFWTSKVEINFETLIFDFLIVLFDYKKFCTIIKKKNTLY